ncbi:hypothetical protein REG_1857 [Candidatus Regiella insecticola LSR1]|uniref:Uncharacterized protein n=2 Tax=Candidatus Regiella insecticola TaxID=138073 RepID=E0WUS2_9ENTR|nr:hypothetical protein REG_1857 [Candidatus Regiella insecticola LSR1]
MLIFRFVVNFIKGEFIWKFYLTIEVNIMLANINLGQNNGGIFPPEPRYRYEHTPKEFMVERDNNGHIIGYSNVDIYRKFDINNQLIHLRRKLMKFDANHQLISITKIRYKVDDKGQLTSRMGVTETFDKTGNLIQINEFIREYDTEQNLISRSEMTKKFDANQQLIYHSEREEKYTADQQLLCRRLLMDTYVNGSRDHRSSTEEFDAKGELIVTNAVPEKLCRHLKAHDHLVEAVHHLATREKVSVIANISAPLQPIMRIAIPN